MCRLAEAEFNADATATATARQWLAEILAHWELGGLADTAVLLTSEIVTNAVQHVGSPPRVTAAVAEGTLEVGVMDSDPTRSPRRMATDDLMATGGRGIAIVDALADDWGRTLLPDGKQVWFRLLTTGWSYSTDCRCPGDEGSVLLQSGRRVRVNRGPWDALPAPNPLEARWRGK